MMCETSVVYGICKDSLDPSSRCVLPSECERKCADPTKLALYTDRSVKDRESYERRNSGELSLPPFI
uniref:ShKT domain-containing protein n=1 Tax=Heterorhabditis bacteriophora TaxID=37862 RepID=A0A1I7XLW4_HETBA